MLMYLTVVLNTRASEDVMMSGIWTGSVEFLKDEDLDLFILCIHKGDITSNKRTGYILAKNFTGVIINNPIEIKFTAGKSINPMLCQCREFDISIDWLGENGYDFFPSEQGLFYYPECGKLVFARDDKVFAVLYKDFAMSDLNEEMPSLKNDEYNNDENEEEENENEKVEEVEDMDTDKTMKSDESDEI